MNSKQIIGLIMANTGETVPVHAARKGYSRAALYDVIKGRTKTPSLREFVAELSGTPESKLWPSQEETA